MLTYRLWRVVLLFSVALLLPIALIRAQPYDSSALRAFLTPPEGCPAPCFMGIQPGVTTLEEALDILSQHAWVVQGSYRESDNQDFNQRAWRWTEAAPAWLDRGTRPQLHASNGRVRYVFVTTTISWGELEIGYGRPDHFAISASNQSYPRDTIKEQAFEGWYGQAGILVYAGGSCGQASTVYDWPVLLYFQADAPPGPESPQRPRPTRCS